MQQPVGQYIEIIRSIYAQNTTTGLGVNEIFRKTSSKNKPQFHDLIKDLETANIIETQKTPDHKQKENKVLTAIGREFAELIENKNNFMAYYKNFEDRVKRYYDIPYNVDSNIRFNKLLDKGYTRDQALSYPQYRREVSSLERQALFSFVQSLLAKYAIILSKFGLDEAARTILISIIVAWLNEILSIELLLMDKGSSEEEKKIVAREDLLKRLAFEAYMLPRVYRMTFEDIDDTDHRFVKEQVKDLVHSLMKLLGPYNEIINVNFVDDLEGFVDHHILEEVRKAHPEAIDYFEKAHRSRSEEFILMKKQIAKEASYLGANILKDVTIRGKVERHDPDLVIKSGEIVYIFVIEYMNIAVQPELIHKWVFDAVDILYDQEGGKIIFVYGGPSFKPQQLEKLRPYYHNVLPIDRIRDYLQSEIQRT